MSNEVMKQEPVKCTCGYSIGHPLVSKCICTPRKEWVGLTASEVLACHRESYDSQFGLLPSTFYRAIEAKLKEKNNV
jgi:hypothetical protein